MMKDMQVGDTVLFYHSNCKEPGVVGLARVASEAYPDFTAWDPDSNYYDPKSTREKPRWYMVDLTFVKKFPREVSLKTMRETPELEGMRLLQKGNRLSIMPVAEQDFQTICKMGGL